MHGQLGERKLDRQHIQAIPVHVALRNEDMQGLALSCLQVWQDDLKVVAFLSGHHLKPFISHVPVLQPTVGHFE